jgi:hypothetical protein
MDNFFKFKAIYKIENRLIRRHYPFSIITLSIFLTVFYLKGLTFATF